MVNSPIKGTANDVDGTDSATIRENTLKLSKIVMPERNTTSPLPQNCHLQRRQVSNKAIIFLAKIRKDVLANLKKWRKEYIIAKSLTELRLTF